jgi:predicted flap endonuclease-1-like 5' DNA nuclease
MTWILLILVLILVVWWLLTQNARQSVEDAPIHEGEESLVHPIEHTGDGSQVAPAVTGIESSSPESPERAVPLAKSLPVEDDLIIIEGIGPKINTILKQAGILTFSDLAKKEPEEIKKLLTEAGLRLGDPASWPEQARLAALGDWEGLQKFQDTLKGGRVV